MFVHVTILPFNLSYHLWNLILWHIILHNVYDIPLSVDRYRWIRKHTTMNVWIDLLMAHVMHSEKELLNSCSIISAWLRTLWQKRCSFFRGIFSPKGPQSFLVLPLCAGKYFIFVFICVQRYAWKGVVVPLLKKSLNMMK